MRALACTLAIVGAVVSLNACDSAPTSPQSPALVSEDGPLSDGVILSIAGQYALAAINQSFLPVVDPVNVDTIIGGTLLVSAPSDSAGNVLYLCRSGGGPPTVTHFRYARTILGNLTFYFDGRPTETGKAYSDGTLAYYRNDGGSNTTGFAFWTDSTPDCQP